MKTISTIFSLLVFITLIVGCEKEPNGPANLLVSDVQFTKTKSRTYLDAPASFSPDNPDFSFNRPETWTGNMAKYVKTIYTYNVSYTVRNIGTGIAYDTEMDIRCSLSNRSEKVVTISLGDLQPGHNETHSNTVSSTNTIVEDCYVEAYWFDL